MKKRNNQKLKELRIILLALLILFLVSITGIKSEIYTKENTFPLSLEKIFDFKGLQDITGFTVEDIYDFVIPEKIENATEEMPANNTNLSEEPIFEIPLENVADINISAPDIAESKLIEEVIQPLEVKIDDDKLNLAISGNSILHKEKSVFRTSSLEVEFSISFIDLEIITNKLELFLDNKGKEAKFGAIDTLSNSSNIKQYKMVFSSNKKITNDGDRYYSEIDSITRAYLDISDICNDIFGNELSYDANCSISLIDKTLEVTFYSDYFIDPQIIIEIIKAVHLGANRNFISNIYDEVRSLDGVWSEEIPNTHYVRVIFENNLTNDKDITIYPRVTLGNPKIEVYEINENEIIATFESIRDNEYNKVFLTNLQGSEDTFDLRVLDGSVEFEHIVDPDVTECGVLDTVNTVYTLTQDVNTSGTCFTISANNITLDGQGYLVNYSQSTTGVGVNNSGTIANATIKNIQLFQGSSNANSHGIRFLGVSESNITNVTITTSSSTSRGILFETTANNNNLIENSTIKTRTGTDAAGIEFSSGNNNIIRRNTINATNNNAIYLTTDKHLIEYNTLISEGSNGGGILLGFADNNIIQHNTIETYGGGDKHGISYFLASINNTITNNTITTAGDTSHGINFAVANNIARNNNITTSGSSAYGIAIGSTSNIVVEGNIILTSGTGNGINIAGISTSIARNNNITGNTITTLGDNVAGITVGDGASNHVGNNTFTNNTIRASGLEIIDYSGSDYINYLIYNNSFGEIKWTDDSTNGFLRNITVSGDLTFPGNITIGNNSAEIITGAFGSSLINSSANVTLYGIGDRGFSNPTILRDGANCGNICYNFTSLTATNVIFNVSYWTNYSVGEKIDTSPTFNNTKANETSVTAPASVNFSTNVSDDILVDSAWFQHNFDATVIETQSSATGNANNNFGSTTWRAQSFIFGNSGEILNGTATLLYNTGTAGNITVEIRTDSTSSPSSTVLANATINAFTSTTETDYVFNFTSPENISAGTTYWLVLSSPSSSSTGTYRWRSANNDKTYKDGTGKVSTDSGSSWSALGRDYRFSLNLVDYLYKNETPVLINSASGSASFVYRFTTAGSYYWSFCANDSTGNENCTNFDLFYVYESSDTTPPNIFFTSYPNGKINGEQISFVGYVEDESASRNISLWVKNGTNPFTFLAVNSTGGARIDLSYDFNSTPYENDASLTFRLLGYDYAGNSNETNLTLTVDHLAPILSNAPDVNPWITPSRAWYKNNDEITLRVNVTDGSGAGMDYVKADLSNINSSGYANMTLESGSQATGQYSTWNLTATINTATGANKLIDFFAVDNATPTSNTINYSITYSVDNDAPYYDNESVATFPTPAFAGENVSHQARWFDNSSGLQICILSTNASNSFVNYTESLSGTDEYCSISVNYTTSGTFSYIFYVNDSVGNTNNTGFRNIVISPTSTINVTEVHLVYPSNNSVFTTSSIDFVVNVTNITQSELSSCWILVNGIQNTTNSSMLVNFNTTFTVSGLEDGNHDFDACCNNTDSVQGCSVEGGALNITISVDTIAPTITITTPLNNTNHSTARIDLNVSSTSTDVSRWWYTNSSGSFNSSFFALGTNLTGATQPIWDEGHNFIRVYINDTSNNINSTYVNFTVDTIAPRINVSSPINNTNYSYSTININVSAVETTTLWSYWWYSNNSGTTNSSSQTPGTNLSLTWDEGHNFVYVWVNDSVNNLNYTTVNFTVDTTNPSISNALINATSIVALNTIVKVNATVTDNIAISNVTIQIDPPDNAPFNITAPSQSGDEFFNDTVVLSQAGQWVFIFHANDTSANNATQATAQDLAGNNYIEVETESGGGGSPSSEGSPGGGGSSSGAGTTTSISSIIQNSSETTYLLRSLGVSPLSIETQLSYIPYITINPSKESENVEIKVEEIASPRIKYPGKVYKYFEVKTTNLPDSFISNVIFTLRIPIRFTNPVLYRYNNEKWASLPTTLIAEEGNFNLYEAESPGLSLFAIAYKAETEIQEELEPNIFSPSKIIKRILHKDELTTNDYLLFVIIPMAVLVILLVLFIYIIVKLIKKHRKLGIAVLLGITALFVLWGYLRFPFEIFIYGIIPITIIVILIFSLIYLIARRIKRSKKGINQKQAKRHNQKIKKKGLNQNKKIKKSRADIKKRI